MPGHPGETPGDAPRLHYILLDNFFCEYLYLAKGGGIEPQPGTSRSLGLANQPYHQIGSPSIKLLRNLALGIQLVFYRLQYILYEVYEILHL